MYTKLMKGEQIISIRENSTNKFIPIADGNYDYQNFLEWEAEPENTANEEQINEPS